jgi:hypothetical protein
MSSWQITHRLSFSLTSSFTAGGADSSVSMLALLFMLLVLLARPLARLEPIGNASASAVGGASAESKAGFGRCLSSSTSLES